jgi:hypothetical protein
MLAIDGLGRMFYVYPPLPFQLLPFIAAYSAIAEVPQQLWLEVMGLNNQRWKEQARAADEWRTARCNQHAW